VCCVWNSLLWVWVSYFILCMGQFAACQEVVIVCCLWDSLELDFGESVFVVCGTFWCLFGEVSLCCVWDCFSGFVGVCVCRVWDCLRGFRRVSVCCVRESLVCNWGSEFVLFVGIFGVVMWLGVCVICAVCGTVLYGFGGVSVFFVWDSLQPVWRYLLCAVWGTVWSVFGSSECVLCVGEFELGLWE